MCEVHRNAISKDSNALKNDLVGHGGESKSCSRNMVAQLLGLDPLPTEQKLSQSSKVATLGKHMSKPHIDMECNQGKKLSCASRHSMKVVKSSIWQQAQEQCQHEANADNVMCFDSLYDDSSDKQHHVPREEREELQRLHAWTSGSIILEPVGHETGAAKVQTLQKMIKTHPRDTCVPASLGATLDGYPSSKQIVQAMNFLQSNREFQKPNSLLARHIEKEDCMNEPCSQVYGSQKRPTYVSDSLESEEQMPMDGWTKSLSRVRMDPYAQQRADKTTILMQHTSTEKPLFLDENLLDCCEQEKNQNFRMRIGAFQSPTKIVLLRPSSGKSHHQIKQTGSGCSPNRLAPAYDRESVKDISQDVLELLAEKLTKVQGGTKMAKVMHGRQRHPDTHGNDMDCSREKARESAKQVREALNRERTHRSTIGGVRMQNKNILRESVFNEEASFLTKNPIQDMIPCVDYGIATKIGFGTMTKKTRGFELKSVSSGNVQKEKTDNTTKLKRPLPHFCQGFTLSVEDAPLFSMCDQSSKKLMVFLNGSNKSHLHGYNSLITNVKDIHGENTVHYTKRLGKLLLETNKTRVDVAVQSLLTRSRRLSSYSKRGAKKQMFRETFSSPEQCETKLNKNISTVVTGKVGTNEACISPLPLPADGNGVFERAHETDAAFQFYKQTQSINSTKTKCVAHASSISTDGFSRERALIPAFSSQHQSFLEHPRHLNISVAEEVDLFKCEMSNCVSCKNSWSCHDSVDFSAASLKLQELQLRLQLLKKDEAETLKKEMDVSEKAAVAKESELIENICLERDSTCHTWHGHVDPSVSADGSSLHSAVDSPKDASSLPPVETNVAMDYCCKNHKSKSVEAAQNGCLLPREMEIQLYVHYVLASSGLTNDSISTILLNLNSCSQPLDPHLFWKLEDDYKGITEAVREGDGNHVFDAGSRRLIFDSMNEILLKMFVDHYCRAATTLRIPISFMPTSRKLLNAIWREICKVSPSNHEAANVMEWEVDFLRYLEALGKELETGILNNLIEEVVYDDMY